MKTLAVASLALCLAASASATPLQARDILVSIRDEGIFAVNPDTGERSLVVAGAFQDFSIAPSGEIYALTAALDPAAAEVVRIDPRTNAVASLSSGGLFVRPVGITVNANGVFVLERTDAGDPVRGVRILEIDATTGAQSVFVADLGVSLAPGVGKSDLESDPDGNLYAAIAKGDATFTRIDARTAEILAFPEDIAATDIGLGIGEHGEIFVATAVGLEDSLFGLDAQSGGVSRIHSGLTSFDVDVEDSGTLIIATDFNNDSLNLCPGTNRCLVRYDAGTHELLHAFTDIRFVNEVQVVPVPEPSAALVFAAGIVLVWRATRAPRSKAR